MAVAVFPQPLRSVNLDFPEGVTVLSTVRSFTFQTRILTAWQAALKKFSPI